MRPRKGLEKMGGFIQEKAWLGFCWESGDRGNVGIPNPLELSGVQKEEAATQPREGSAKERFRENRRI